jgi:NlpC/P60 family
MRRWVLGGGWLLVCSSCALWAQSRPAVGPAKQTSHAAIESAKAARSPRLLDANDGLAVLGAALETRHKSEMRSDCSHLVHAIYEKAGFPYKYQSSSDLYAGDDDFQRVWHPQAGDLIAWPGHAGIVVNPAQHTFYSALRSGFGVQPYDSVYWKGRGRPHFLRYIKARPAPVMAARRVVGMKPAAVRSAEIESLPAIAPSVAPENSPDPSVPSELAASQAAGPLVVAVKSAHPKPEQIRASLAEHFQSAGEDVHTQDPLNFQLPVVAFDRFEIQKVYVKGDIGWTQIHFRGFVVLAGRNAQAGKPRDVQRFMMRRDGSEGWEIILPTDAVYLPRDVAVRTLAHQLAALTDSAPNAAGKSDERVELARWLDVLLEQR